MILVNLRRSFVLAANSHETKKEVCFDAPMIVSWMHPLRNRLEGQDQRRCSQLFAWTSRSPGDKMAEFTSVPIDQLEAKKPYQPKPLESWTACQHSTPRVRHPQVVKWKRHRRGSWLNALPGVTATCVGKLIAALLGKIELKHVAAIQGWAVMIQRQSKVAWTKCTDEAISERVVWKMVAWWEVIKTPLWPWRDFPGTWTCSSTVGSSTHSRTAIPTAGEGSGAVGKGFR